MAEAYRELQLSAGLLPDRVVAVEQLWPGEFLGIVVRTCHCQEIRSFSMRHTTFRFTLDPTPEQVALLARHAGASRFACNQCLRFVSEALAARQINPSVTVPWSGFDLINASTPGSEARTPAACSSSLKTEWSQSGQLASVARELSAQVFEEAAVDLGRALAAYAKAKRVASKDTVSASQRRDGRAAAVTASAQEPAMAPRARILLQRLLGTVTASSSASMLSSLTSMPTVVISRPQTAVTALLGSTAALRFCCRRNRRRSRGWPVPRP